MALERPRILTEASGYVALAGRNALDEIDAVAFEPENVSLEQLKALYERLRDRAAPRKLYEELLSRARLKRCPYCSDREAETLDHYLSKAEYAQFAVLAANLVPSCYACNNKKNAYELARVDAQATTLHPYFDDVSGVRWLRARIVDGGGGPVARLFVDGSSIPEPAVRRKAMEHLRAFGLRKYFKLRSAQELAGLDDRLPRMLHESGRSAVVSELLAQALQRAGGRSNSWEGALFEALSESSWYLDTHLVGLKNLPLHGVDPRRPIPI
ncbi:hypothetical protein OYT00_03180 [Microbacterium paraoxydans]|nr:hypothetical protein [Microbacterium paraoxydans]